jgi:hypothetical protein
MTEATKNPYHPIFEELEHKKWQEGFNAAASSPIECYVPVTYEEESKINEDSKGVIHSEIGWLKKVTITL